MFSNWFLKSFRILLFPFAIIYGIGVWLRNWLYDKNILKSTSFGLPLISVGNLSVGGTGKSPMVEYLANLLRSQYKIAILSRGYKRKTKGYALADQDTTAIDIGDEPMQFYKKFPGVPVAVGEKRIEAIPQLLHDRPDTELIILDDAFQHREIEAGFNILLTEQGNLFTRDFFLPTGDLRDEKRSKKRADLIVITKCDPALDNEEKENLIKELSPTPHQKIYFTTIDYGQPYHIINRKRIELEEQTEVLLITGIANPRPLKEHLEDWVFSYHLMNYGDHHIFSIMDWREIKNKFDQIEAMNKIILTTEKDAMRLLKFENELAGMPFYVIPIEHKFLFNEGPAFDQSVINFIENFKHNG